MTLSILAVHEAAEALLNCVCDSLAALPAEVPGLAGCPCRACVVPGTPAADACDGGCNVQPGEYPGQLSVNVVRMFTSDAVSFPRELATVRDLRNCGLPAVTAVELAVTVWRCVPLPSDDGCPPSCAELSASAMQLHADMLAVNRGILCCYAGTIESRKGRRYVLGASTTLGPSGGCGGFTTRVVVALDDVTGPIPATP